MFRTILFLAYNRMYTSNPKTGKKILVNGPTYLKLARDPKWSSRLWPAPSAEIMESPKRKAKSKGCSRYINSAIPDDRFCGLEGGTCPHTFPVDTPKRARAALAYSRHAPNPSGIKRCVHRIAQEEGLEDPLSGKLMMSPSKRKTPQRSPYRRY